MTSVYQANEIAHKVMGEYNIRPFNIDERVIELVKEETSNKEEQTNLFFEVKASLNQIFKNYF